MKKLMREINYRVTFRHIGEMSYRRCYQLAPDKITAAFRVRHFEGNNIEITKISVFRS